MVLGLKIKHEADHRSENKQPLSKCHVLSLSLLLSHSLKLTPHPPTTHTFL